MSPENIIQILTTELDGVAPKASWGETALFYNPGNLLPNGVYFCTIKEKDGDHDKSSNLKRDSIFRLSIGVGKDNYEKHFGTKPKRPAKGCIVNTGHDFTKLDELMPHPIYAWMSWVQILSPSKASFDLILPLIKDAHAIASLNFNKKVTKNKGQAV
ncbi:DUF6194 family protein [Catenovulum maritimum]|uniref:DUF6194 domain-containing protein n=1 Tax=Catenovulum maritimum TaxID=1513271 RepID=A0A0J8H1M8_9ALTE|nr:DUF6194 family protein [Catenovulum maritimum]KMT66933.1 hypothetical protein XM47_02190 [Catenovulum maritimum]